MKWFNKRKPCQEAPDPATARERLEQIRAQREDVDRLVGELRHYRVENHFAQRVFSLSPREGR